MAKTPGMLLYVEDVKVLLSLGADDTFTVLQALTAYAENGIEPDGMPPACIFPFRLMSSKICEAQKRYAEISAARSDAASKRWEHANNANACKCTLTEQNINKQNKEDRDNPSIVPPQGDGDEGFETFWKAYPKKVGKGAAEKAFRKIKGGKEVLQAMLDTLAWQKTSERWQRDNGQYIPNPATWLNQRRWEDEQTEAAPVRGMDIYIDA